MDFYVYDDILDIIQFTDKKSLDFKPSKSGQILCVGFPRPGHIYSYSLGIIKQKYSYAAHNHIAS